MLRRAYQVALPLSLLLWKAISSGHRCEMLPRRALQRREDSTTSREWFNCNWKYFTMPFPKSNFKYWLNPLIFAASSVTCHCSHCALENFMCKTDGICYISWRKHKESLTTIQGCLDRKYLFPPGEPLYCEARQVTDYNRRCCPSNFCNSEDLKLDPGLNVYALFFFVAFILSLSMIFYLNLRWK